MPAEKFNISFVVCLKFLESC